MAEKGIIVADAASGESVACRDAVEADESSNSRIIQIIDQSSRKNSIVMATPLRSGVTTSDSFDLATIPTGILSNALTIGDAPSICVAVTYEDSGTDRGIYITPIIIELSNDNAIGLLEPKKFTAVTEEWEDGYASQFNIGSNRALTIAQTWQVFGAYRVGFHINFDTTTNVNLYACTCSDLGSGFTAINNSALGGAFGLGDYVS